MASAGQGQTNGAGAGPAHDAFLSYSRADKALARCLARALSAYRPPKDLPVPQRELRVFRDEDDFTGVDYFAAVERHLTDSASLIVLCSPNARRSRYVDDEIRRFAAARGAARIVPVLGAGLPNNEAVDGREAQGAFPDALCELMTMPLAVSYVGFDPKKDKVDKGAFEGAWYTLLSNLYGVSRSEIEQRDKRRQARARRLRLAVAGAFVASIVLGLTVSLFQWRAAVVARDLATSREFAAHARVQRDEDPDLGVKLARHALRVAATGEAEAALRDALVANRSLAVMAGRAWIHGMALTADGRQLLTAAQDGGVRLWDGTTGQPVAELAGHRDLVAGVDIAADGRHAVSASWDGSAIVWDLQTRRALHRLDHAGAPVTGVCFSADGFVVASAADGVLRLWRADDGQMLHQIDAHARGSGLTTPGMRVACSPDGRRVLSSSGVVSTAAGEPVARLWDMDSGALLHEMRHDLGVVLASQFSADGQLAFSASDRGGARVWEVSSGAPLVSLDAHRGLVHVAALSPDGGAALTADQTHGITGEVLLWDARTGKLRATLFGGVTAAAFDSRGSLVATGHERGVRVWDARTGVLMHELRGHSAEVTVLRFGADDATLVSASRDGTARVWDLHTPPELALVGLDSGSTPPQYSPDGRWIVADSTRVAKVWESRRGTPVAEFADGHALFARDAKLLVVDRALGAPRAEVIRAAAGGPALEVLRLPAYAGLRSGDERWVLLPQDDFSARVVERDSWREVGVLKGHEGPVQGAAFDRDGRWVMTAGSDGSARVWDPGGGAPRQTFRLDNRGHAVHLSADGRLACVVQDASAITLWDTETWTPRHRFGWPAPPAGGNWAKVAAFDPDGSLLVVGDDRGLLHFLDTAAGRESATVAAHKYAVETLAFSADGRFLVTTGRGDRGARVWDAASGEKLAEVGTQAVVGAAFKPDGSQLAVLAADGTLRLYDRLRFAPLDELTRLAATRVQRDWTPGERERYFRLAPVR